MAEARTRKFVITRFDPDKDEVPKTQEYEIACHEDWKVLDAINFIKDEVDPSISHRWSCRMAVCGSCGMMVNGRAHGPQKGVATCELRMRNFSDGDRIVVEPFRATPFLSLIHI